MADAIARLHSWIRLEISDLVLSGLAGEMTIPRDFGFQILVEKEMERWRLAVAREKMRKK